MGGNFDDGVDGLCSVDSDDDYSTQLHPIDEQHGNDDHQVHERQLGDVVPVISFINKRVPAA